MDVEDKLPALMTDEPKVRQILINLLQNAVALTGGSALGFGTSSACSSVNAVLPALTVTSGGSAIPIAGFLPVLTAGNSFSLVAYPTSAGAIQFATLSNAFTPTTGLAGLRVFNATSGTTAYDVYVTAAGAPLGTATVANVAVGGSGSAFVNVPAGAQEIRVTSAGESTVLVDLASETLMAGQNLTLVIAPPANGSTTLRAFLIADC